MLKVARVVILKCHPKNHRGPAGDRKRLSADGFTRVLADVAAGNCPHCGEPGAFVVAMPMYEVDPRPAKVGLHWTKDDVGWKCDKCGWWAYVSTDASRAYSRMEDAK